MEEIVYLKKMHKKQLEKQKSESDEVIAELTKEKEEASSLSNDSAVESSWSTSE